MPLILFFFFLQGTDGALPTHIYLTQWPLGAATRVAELFWSCLTIV